MKNNKESEIQIAISPAYVYAHAKKTWKNSAVVCASYC